MKNGHGQHCAWERHLKTTQSFTHAVATLSNQAAEQDGISIIQQQCVCR